VQIAVAAVGVKVRRSETRIPGVVTARLKIAHLFGEETKLDEQFSIHYLKNPYLKKNC